MRALDKLGVFWLPGHEEKALSGRLQFDPKGDGITLSLVGRFDNEPDNGAEQKCRIIGWLGNDKVTLDRCSMLGTKTRSSGIDESKYYAIRMFVGHHFDLDELTFQSATIVLVDLDSWVGRSGITEERGYRHHQFLYRMSFTPLPEESRPFSQGRVTLDFSWKSRGDSIHGVAFQQWPVIRIEYNQMQAFGIIYRDVSRVQNLMMLCIDAPAAIDDLILKRSDMALSGEDSRHEQSIEFFALPLRRYVEPHERKPHPRHRMLLNFEELGGIATIARWLDTSQGFQRALDSFMSIKHANEMFVENSFLNVTFAAEAFHRTMQDAPYMDEGMFERLLSVYLENTPEEHRRWLRGKVRNEPTLRKRLERLAAGSGAATRPLIGEKERWAYTVSQVRNELTHLGNNSRMFDGGDLTFLTESVYAVVRICMLMECGVSPETLIEKVNSPTITWYRERLKETIERVRSQFTSN
ncbi:MAG TPA: HEPN domain-containing protein [Pseudonocardiaceae bacterium]|nr:HEPN domain-containing protein [Pseudonocardiaceae bacterium]